MPQRPEALAERLVVEREAREADRLPDFGSFTPPPPVLFAPALGAPEAVPVAGGAWERAQVAAVAERLLTSFRVGKADGRDEVRLRLGGRHDAEVRVQIVDGRVIAKLVGHHLEPLAQRLLREMEARGLDASITTELP